MVHDAKERGLMFDKLRDELQTTTLVGADESQKALQSLNQYEKTLNGRAEQVSLKNTINYYNDNQERLFGNEMTLEELDEFDFHDDAGSTKGTTERDWSDYIAGAAEVAVVPVAFDSREGIESVMDAVLNYSMKSINAKTAMDDIYTPALLDQSVTSETAMWAIGKINEPFPEAFARDLKGVVDSNYDVQRSIFNVKLRQTEDQEASAINRSLMIWADENTTKTTDKDGKVTWKTPSLEQLEDQSAQYRATVKREGIGALGGVSDIDNIPDEIPSPLTAEEYNSLPSGTVFYHPDDPEGVTSIKP
jgi:hypothetical protein